MPNNVSLTTHGAKILYNKMKATIKVIGSNEIAIQFDSPKIPTIVLDLEVAESQLLKTIQFRNPKADSPILPTALTSTEQIEKIKIQTYLDELNVQAGPGGVGGSVLRQKVIDKVASEIEDVAKPSVASLARWQNLENVNALGITQTILHRRKNKRKGRYEDSAIKELALVCIDDYFLDERLGSIIFAHKKYDQAVQCHYPGVKTPTRQTFTNWINEICAIDKAVKRLGKRNAKQVRRNAVNEIKTERPLQRVEADGLHLAIGIIDEDGNYIGRIIILFVFDAFTRCVLGFKVSVGKGESSSSIIDSYRHALLPKTIGAGCKHNYPMYGAFESIFTDGGKGYLAKEPNAFLLIAGVQQDVTQSYSGWLKPFVERFNGTVRSQFASKFKSYCGRMGDDRSSELTIKQKATLTLPKFEELLEKWIVDEYHQTVHSKLGCTPYEKWMQYFQNRSPMLPANMDFLSLPCGETRMATISGTHCHLGVQINKLKYNDADGKLKAIGMKLKAFNTATKVECRYSETNIYQILVIDPFDGSDFTVETTSNAVTDGMSLQEYKAIIAARDEKSNPPESDGSFEAEVDAINALTDEKTKGMRTKKQTTAKPSDIEQSIQKMKAEQAKAVAMHDITSTEPTEFEEHDINEEETYDEI